MVNQQLNAEDFQGQNQNFLHNR